MSLVSRNVYVCVIDVYIVLCNMYVPDVVSCTCMLTAPDGVKPPVLSSPSSHSLRAIWGAVGRNNADQEPAFQLHFRAAQMGSQIEKYVLPSFCT